MTPQEFAEWLKKATLKELCDSVVWEQVMEGTAWCGWTERARLGLVKQVQDSVKWAIDKKINNTSVAKLTEVSKKMRDFLDGPIANLECNSRQRNLPEEVWSEAMYLRDLYDITIEEMKEKT